MHKYYIVVGLLHKYSNQLNTVVSKIRDSFYVDAFSQTFYAESEDISYPGPYLNFAFQISSVLSYEDLKNRTKDIEQCFFIGGSKILDLDIILQFKSDELIYVDKTLDKYCHTLITLNDLIPDQSIDNITISKRLFNHKNNNMFSVFNKVLV